MKTVSELINYCKTQELNKRLIFLINSWVNNNVEYKREADYKDYWQSPSETIKLMTGDCEDIAILKAYILLSLDDVKEDDLMFFHVVAGTDNHVVLNFHSVGVLDNRHDTLESDNDMIINFAFDLDNVYHGQKVSENNLGAFEKAKNELKEINVLWNERA